ncbi:hyalin-like [Lytechinus variegatus]|uniref:hyalin-like n=1 Tax=Lytechinus variegatus TaxID=7654 RepID=UPI001BB2A801|nr:hyalin-like [Lytechinus variegatus]
MYAARATVLYLLYIPSATKIMFTFSNPFELEKYKDDLTVGPGLAVDFDLDLRGEDIPNRDVHHFSGNKVPKDFVLDDTDSAWMYFLTDKNTERSGFQVNWTSEDRLPPVIVCPSDVTVPALAGSQSASVTWVQPTTSEPVFVQSDFDSGHEFGIGRNVVIYTATDEAGNEGQCFFYVTVEGDPSTNLAPVISGCPVSRTPAVYNTSPLATSLPVFFQPPNASNPVNASDIITTVSSQMPGDVFDHGVHLVLYRFITSNGLQADCVIPIQVSEVDFCASRPCDPDLEICHHTPTSFYCFVIANDTVEPELVDCPDDIRVFTAPLDLFVSVNWTEPTASDDSGRVVLESSHSSGDLFSTQGPLAIVIYEARDMNNNSAMCSFSVNVTADDTGPNLTCPENITLPLNGSSDRVVTWPEVTAYDPSGPVSIIQNHHPNDSFPSESTTAVIYVASDRYGNINFCSFIVTIVDMPSPQHPFPVQATIALIVVIGMIILVAMMIMFLIKSKKDRKKEEQKKNASIEAPNSEGQSP